MDASIDRCIANAPLVSDQWNILQTPAVHLPTHNSQSQPGSVGSLNPISSYNKVNSSICWREFSACDISVILPTLKQLLNVGEDILHVIMLDTPVPSFPQFQC